MSGRRKIPEIDGPSTASMLVEMYGRRPVIPLEQVRKDWFSHLTMGMFVRKLSLGDISLPVIRMENSQKAPRGVHLNDMADWIDNRREEASKLLAKMAG